MKAFLAGWLVAGLGIFGLSQYSVYEDIRTEDAYSAWMAEIETHSQLDTVTYQDDRIVYKVPITYTETSEGDSIPTFTLSGLPATADFIFLMEPAGDSALLVTYDTAAASPTDSTTVDAIYVAWGLTAPPAYSLTVPGTPESGGGFDNEPAGFVVLTEHRFSDSTNAPYEDWDINPCDLGKVGMITDATAPYSPDSVGYMGYPWGHSGGSAPCNWFASGADIDSLKSDSAYVSWWIKLSDDFVGHPSGVNKGLFITRDGAAAAPIYSSTQGILDHPIRFQIRTQGLQARNLSGNQGANDTIYRGQWHHLELLAVLDTPHSGVDYSGIIKVWIDGVLTHDYDDVLMWDSTASLREWNNIKWNPTWGGTGSTLDTVCTPGDGDPCGGGAPATDTLIYPPGDTMYKWLDHLYISGNEWTFANEPAGMTTIVESRFNEAAPTCFNDITSDPEFGVYSTGSWNPAGATLDSVSTPPWADDDSIATALFTPALTPGTAPINLNMTSACAANGEQYNEAYYSFYFQATPNHEVSNVNKIGFVELGDSTAANGGSSIYFALLGPTAPALHADSFQFAWFQQGPSTPEDYFADRYTCDGGRIIKAGTWHQIEMYTKLNSVTAQDSMVQDGLLRVWIDGLLCATSDTMSFRGWPHSDSGNRVFSRWKFNPTNGSTAVPDTSYQMISHLRFSGKKTD